MAGVTKEEYAAFILRYYNHPGLFVREQLGGDPYPWQDEIMAAVARGVRNIAARSGHRVGKSTVVAWICLWYMLTRSIFKIGVTAPTAGQLFDAMYAELKTWYLKLQPALQLLLDVKSDRIDLTASGGASFLTIKTGRVENPEALAGLHSENTLLIGDEASGIADLVFESSTSSMAAPNAQIILTGNPLRATGYFAMCFEKWQARWTLFTISSYDCPNVSREWIEEKKDEYGEESNAFRARVLGLPPRGDDDTIIPLDMVTSAVGREVVTVGPEDEIWGLDVAELGSCVSALVRRRGKAVRSKAEIFAGLEPMQLVGRIYGIYSALPDDKQPKAINVDGIGYGAGVASRLSELGLPAYSINVANTPSIAGEAVYFNLRTELWYIARQWFADRDCTIPQDDRLISDITKIRLVDSPEGRKQTLRAESKKMMRDRKVPSPDVGDAFVLTFAGIALTSKGTGYSKYRGKPLRRRLKGVTYV